MGDCSMGHDYYKQFESRNFLCVTGTITHSELQTHTSKGNTYYTAVINYVYKVSGQTFTGDRLVYTEDGPGLSEPTIVSDHPVGSAVQVYYNSRNPRDSLLYPGGAASGFQWVLGLTPFNMVAIGFWAWISGWLRLRMFKPVAGGAKIIEDGMITRVRLPRWGAFWWWLVTTGGLGFVSLVIMGISEQLNLPIAPALPSIFTIYLAGIGVYIWRRLKIKSGAEDLIINEGTRTLELPLTLGRKERMMVGFRDIQDLTVKPVEHNGGKGKSISFAPTLSLRGNQPEQKLAEWPDPLKAVNFTVWLREKTGVSRQA
jgi:hypothetical protein